MKIEEAKKMAMSRDCHCIKGKDRDNNYISCIDKVFDYFESQLKNHGVIGSVSGFTAVDIERAYNDGKNDGKDSEIPFNIEYYR